MVLLVFSLMLISSPLPSPDEDHLYHPIYKNEERNNISSRLALLRPPQYSGETFVAAQHSKEVDLVWMECSNHFELK